MAINDLNQLQCAGCGFEYTHCESIEIFHQVDDTSKKNGVHITVKGLAELKIDRDISRNPSARRDGVRMTFSCENCDVLSVLTIAQHKGNTFVEYDPGK